MGTVVELLARIRGSLTAVRTGGGIMHGPRPVPSEIVWTRLAEVGDDGRYDRLLAVVWLLAGVGAFVAILLVDVSGPRAVRLAAVSLVASSTPYSFSGRHSRERER
jgi:hypothetical protein